MGYFRFLFKPIKRFYFYYADKVAEKWSSIVREKYTKKFIRKTLLKIFNQSRSIC